MIKHEILFTVDTGKSTYTWTKNFYCKEENLETNIYDYLIAKDYKLWSIDDIKWKKMPNDKDITWQFTDPLEKMDNQQIQKEKSKFTFKPQPSTKTVNDWQKEEESGENSKNNKQQ